MRNSKSKDILYIALLLGFNHAKASTYPFDETIYDARKLAEVYGINESLELKNLIRKTKTASQIEFTNKTDKKATVGITLKNPAQNLSMNHRFNISPGSNMEWDFSEGWEAENIISPGTRDQFLSFGSTESKLSLSITPSEELVYPQRARMFDFAPPALAPAGDTDPALNPAQKKFDTLLNHFINHLCPDEKINPDDFFQYLNNLYQANNISKVLSENSKSDAPLPFKIPQIIHTIWLTNPESPVEMPEQYIGWMKEALSSNPVEEGWKHQLWVQNRKLLPETIHKLNGSSIEIMETDDLEMPVKTAKVFLNEISNSRFGRASEILRYLVLKKMGGIYKDTDYLISQSCNVFSKSWDFYAGLEPDSPFIGNSFLAARPGHPVMNTALDMIIRNYGNEAPMYIKDINGSDNNMTTTLITGSGVLTAAFYLAKRLKSYADIILPPMVVYPTQIDSYPQNDVVKPGEFIPAESLGAHYMEGSRYNPAFKSNG